MKVFETPARTPCADQKARKDFMENWERARTLIMMFIRRHSKHTRARIKRILDPLICILESNFSNFTTSSGLFQLLLNRYKSRNIDAYLNKLFTHIASSTNLMWEFC